MLIFGIHIVQHHVFVPIWSVTSIRSNHDEMLFEIVDLWCKYTCQLSVCEYLCVESMKPANDHFVIWVSIFFFIQKIKIDAKLISSLSQSKNGICKWQCTNFQNAQAQFILFSFFSIELIWFERYKNLCSVHRTNSNQCRITKSLNRKICVGFGLQF